MTEGQQSREAEPETTLDKAIRLLESQRVNGVDFEPEDFEDLREASDDEVVERTLMTLEIADLDGETLITEWGLIQTFVPHPDEVHELQNQGSESYTTAEADELLNRIRDEQGNRASGELE